MAPSVLIYDRVGDVTLSATLRFADNRFEINNPTVSYKNHRFPLQIIAHAVWPYLRFPQPVADRGNAAGARHRRIVRNDPAMGPRKFRPGYAKQLRRRKTSRQDIWHLDEVMISIAGRKH